VKYNKPKKNRGCKNPLNKKDMKETELIIEKLIAKIQNGTATSIDHENYIKAKNVLRTQQKNLLNQNR